MAVVIKTLRGTHVDVVSAGSYLADRIGGTFSSEIVPSLYSYWSVVFTNR